MLYNRNLLIPLLTVLLLAPLIAGGNTEIPAPEKIVIDALGRSVSVPGDPQRIALAGRAVIMLNNAIYAFPGASEKIVGLSQTDQGLGDFMEILAPDRKDIIRWGNDAGAEQILEANPDVVLLKSFMKEGLGDPLEKMGIPVIYLDLETPAQYERDIATVGALLNQEDRARELIDFYNREVAAVRANAPTVKPQILILYYSTKGGSVSFQVPPRGWIQTTMAETAGAIPVWVEEALSPGWNRVGLEQIAAWDPEQIYLVSYNLPAREAVEKLKADPAWAQFRAVKTGRFYAFPGDYYSWGQPDSRWILGLWWLSRRMESDLSQTVFQAEVEEKAARVFRYLYDLDDTRTETLIKRIR
jgi:iron complex transport system substrate-binding protein